MATFDALIRAARAQQIGTALPYAILTDTPDGCAVALCAPPTWEAQRATFPDEDAARARVATVAPDALVLSVDYGPEPEEMPEALQPAIEARKENPQHDQIEDSGRRPPDAGEDCERTVPGGHRPEDSERDNSNLQWYFELFKGGRDAAAD